MNYSKTAHQAGGSGFFFDGDVKAPTDAFEVSKADILTATNLPAGATYEFDAGRQLVVSLAPEPTLEDVKANAAAGKWVAIKAKRDHVVLQGVMVGGKWYHTDEASRTKYIGLLRMADAALTAGGTGGTPLQYGGQDIYWKTMDNTFVTMTVQRANDIFAAVSGLDFVAFGIAEIHRSAMQDAVDPSTYDFSARWPATFPG